MLQNNNAPWARTSPASPANVLREIGSEIGKEERKELQALITEDKKLEAEYEQFCSANALEASKQQEIELLNDFSVPAQTAANKVRELREFRERSPIISDRIQRQRGELLKRLFPVCAQLCVNLTKAIDDQLAELPKVEVAARWGIPLNGDFWNAVRYPLLRLRSMVEYDLPIFKRGAVDHAPNFTAHYLVEAAGLIGQPEKSNPR